MDYVSELALHLVSGGELPQLSSPFCYLLPVILIVLGLFEGLMGKKFYKLQIYLAGFTFGATVGATIIGFIEAKDWFTMPDIVPLIVILGLGILGLVLLSRLIKFGIFLCGALVLFFMANIVTGNMVISLIAFVIGGILALLMEKPVMVVATSLAGGFLIVFGGAKPLIPVQLNHWVWFAIALAVSIGFMTFQFKKHGRND